MHLPIQNSILARLSSYTIQDREAALRVIFLVSGADKSEVIRQVLKSPSTPAPAFPAQLVRPHGGAAAWYIDEAAASLL